MWIFRFCVRRECSHMPCQKRAENKEGKDKEDDFMKKKLLAAALAVMCLSIAAYGTLAYFTASDIATNVVTAGNVEIELKETTAVDGQDTPGEFEDLSGIVAGQEVSKIVQVENVGDNPAYVRIEVEKAITLAEGMSGEVDLDLIQLDFNTADWVEKDGYYYYKYPVAANEITTPLFTTVTFGKDMDNLYQNSKATITVRAQAVQSQNNGSDVLKASGWPQE